MVAEKIRITHYGLGPIGLAIAKRIPNAPGMEIAGAVNIANEMVGKDISEMQRVESFLYHFQCSSPAAPEN